MCAGYPKIQKKKEVAHKKYCYYFDLGQQLSAKADAVAAATAATAADIAIR